jgi:HSP20 family protein
MVGDHNPLRRLMLSAASAFENSSWQPRVDVYRTGNGWLLKYELAGVDAHQVEVQLRGNAISVYGQRRDVRVEEGQTSYSMEIAYHHFERTLELPCVVSGMEVDIDYRDGMLIVRLTPKAPRP